MSLHDPKWPKQHQTPLLDPKGPVFPNKAPCGPTNWFWAKKTNLNRSVPRCVSFTRNHLSYRAARAAKKSSASAVPHGGECAALSALKDCPVERQRRQGPGLVCPSYVCAQTTMRSTSANILSTMEEPAVIPCTNTRSESLLDWC